MEQVKEILSALRMNYLQDLPAYIDGLEDLFLKIERTGYEEDLCQDLFRNVHSLKGSGGTYGLHFLSDVCHPLEDLISQFIEKKNDVKVHFCASGLKYIDLLRVIQITYLKGHEPDEKLRLSLKELRQSDSKLDFSALIVETSDVVIGMLRESLIAQGYRIEVMSDGYLALGRLLSEPFDLLITALETQRLNGIGLISAISVNKLRNKKLHTVLLTSTHIKINPCRPDHIIMKNADLRANFKTIIQNINK